MNSLPGREEVRRDVLVGAEVDGSFDVSSGVLVLVSTVDDVVIRDLRGVLALNEIAELKREEEAESESRRGLLRTGSYLQWTR